MKKFSLVFVVLNLWANSESQATDTNPIPESEKQISIIPQAISQEKELTSPCHPVETPGKSTTSIQEQPSKTTYGKLWDFVKKNPWTALGDAGILLGMGALYGYLAIKVGETATECKKDFGYGYLCGNAWVKEIPFTNHINPLWSFGFFGSVFGLTGCVLRDLGIMKPKSLLETSHQEENYASSLGQDIRDLFSKTPHGGLGALLSFMGFVALGDLVDKVLTSNIARLKSHNYDVMEPMGAMVLGAWLASIAWNIPLNIYENWKKTTPAVSTSEEDDDSREKVTTPSHTQPDNQQPLFRKPSWVTDSTTTSS